MHHVRVVGFGSSLYFVLSSGEQTLKSTYFVIILLDFIFEAEILQVHNIYKMITATFLPRSIKTSIGICYLWVLMNNIGIMRGNKEIDFLGLRQKTCDMVLEPAR